MTKVKDKNVLSPSSREELGALDKKFTVISALRDRIGSVIDELGLGGKSKAIVSAAVLSLVFGLSDVQAQSSQDQIDKKKIEVLNKQKPLFIDAMTLLNQPDIHNWVYTQLQKGKVTGTLSDLSGGDKTLEDLLERHRSALSNDQKVMLKKDMKIFLMDTISSLLMKDVLTLVELQSDWYKDKNNINQDQKDMEQFPVLKKHVFTIDQKDLLFPHDSVQIDQKVYKKIIKDIARKYDVKKSTVKDVIDTYSFVDPVKNPDKENGIKSKDAATSLEYLYELGQLPDDKKIDSAALTDYLSVLTKSDLRDYLDNNAYSYKDFIDWLTIKKQLLLLLKVPELSKELETIVFEDREKALIQYKKDLESHDQKTRNNAKANFITNLFKYLRKDLSPKVDELLDHAIDKYTEQDK